MERRSAIELRSAGNKKNPQLVGYAAVFDSPSSDLGGFTEIVRRGAFTRSLQSNRTDPLALVHHLPHLVLGRRSAGTLRLQEDQRGLGFEIDLPQTMTAADLLISVERGDVRGASFAFSTPKGGDKWETRGEQVIRELLDVDLLDVTITPTPAYPDTEVARRALAEIAWHWPRRFASARRFLESV